MRGRDRTTHVPTEFWQEVPENHRYLLTERLIGAVLMAIALLDQEGESDNARKVAGVLQAVLGPVAGRLTDVENRKEAPTP